MEQQSNPYAETKPGKDPVLDIAKGIGILLVVAGHCAEWASPWIYLFHMPLFFFFSGYCYKAKHHENLRAIGQLIRRRLSTLYLPFVGYGILFVALHNVFFSVDFYTVPDAWRNNHMIPFQGVHDYVSAFVGTLAFARVEQLLAPFWFLPILFCATFGFACISYLAKKFGERETTRAILLLLLFAVACAIGVTRARIPRVYTLSVLGMVAIYIGVLARKLPPIRGTKEGVCLAILFLCLSTWYGRINVAGFRFASPGFFIACTIAGAYLVIGLSDLFYRKSVIDGHVVAGGLVNLLRYAGVHTIPVMALHYVSFKLVNLCVVYACHLPATALAKPTLLPGTALDVVYCAVGFLVPLGYVRVRDYVLRKQK